MRRGRHMRGWGPWGPAPWLMMGGCGGWWGEGPEDVEAHIAALEEFQRDLEEATADVAERIRRLKERRAETVSS